MAAEVVVVGSMGADYITTTPRFPRPGETIFGHSITVGFGGKGINQCIVAERLGASTAFVGKLGYDQVGDNFLKTLKDTSIDITHISRTDQAQSAVANVTVDDTGENCIVIAPGANRFITVDDVTKAGEVIKSAKVLVCQNEITMDATKAALVMARKNGVTTVYNAAPAIPDVDDEILENTDILCVNETEAEVLSGVQVISLVTAAQAGHMLLSKGCGGVLVTLGAEGAVWVPRDNDPDCRDDNQWVGTERVKAVDTTGAGDAFLGALAFFIARYPVLSFKEKMKRACSVATVSVTRPGAWNSFPSREELPPKLFQDS